MGIIEVEQLKKSYGPVQAVKGIDFEVQEGSMFAFLGPNGAGKSTTIDMISTQIKPDSGRIMVSGYEIGKEDAKIRENIGIVFQDSVLDARLSVKENLMVRSSFYAVEAARRQQVIEYAARITDVLEFWNRPYGKLSGGQRRRADIARALVNTPRVLILDEPTTGLDPQTRKLVWDTIHMLKKGQGMTIFLTTHYMEEAAQADIITIIDHGKIMASDTPLALKEKYTTDVLKILPSKPDFIIQLLKEQNIEFQQVGKEIIVPVKHTVDTIPLIEQAKDGIQGFEVIRGSMNDVFLNITGSEVRA